MRVGNGGYIGVDVFFALSGFLITTLLRQEVEATETIGLRAFFERRIRRLLPALVALAGGVAVVWLVIPGLNSRSDTLVGSVLSIGYVGSWTKAYGIASLGWLGHTWSLSVEEHFYVVWPFVVWGLRRFSLSVVVRVTAALAALSTAEWYVGVARGWSTDRLVFAPDTRAKDLLAGCLLALAFERGVPRRLVGLGSPAIVALGAWSLLVAKESAFYLLGWPIVVLSSACVISTLFAEPTAGLSRTLSRPLFEWIGKRSYGIYLWHFPLTAINSSIVDWPRAAKGVIALATIVASIGLAALSYRYVEMPFRRSRTHQSAARYSYDRTRRE